MIDHHNTVIVIPARMASATLPGKPLADIHGLPMIVHVWRRAIEAGIGHVLVAAAENAIADAVRQVGGDAMVTPPNLPASLNRVAAALAMRDPAHKFENVLSLSADMPTIDALSLRRCLAGLTNEKVDLACLAAEISDSSLVASATTVKTVAPLWADREVAYARDFVREVNETLEPPFWQHVSIYAYRRTVLEKLAAMPPSTRETLRKIEVLRALDHDLRVAVVKVDSAPLCVDTPTSLEAARRSLRIG